MNELEQALQSNEALDDYLEITPSEQIREDFRQLIQANTKHQIGTITKQIIEKLQLYV